MAMAPKRASCSLPCWRRRPRGARCRPWWRRSRRCASQCAAAATLRAALSPVPVLVWGILKLHRTRCPRSAPEAQAQAATRVLVGCNRMGRDGPAMGRRGRRRRCALKGARRGDTCARAGRGEQRALERHGQAPRLRPLQGGAALRRRHPVHPLGHQGAGAADERRTCRAPGPCLPNSTLTRSPSRQAASVMNRSMPPAP